MKHRTFGAVGAAVALAATAVLAAAPAIAADVYHDPSVALGAEGDSYPEGWFVGAPAPSVAPTFEKDAVTITGRAQLLYGDVIENVTGEAFLTAIADADAAVDGDATFQIPVYFDAANATQYSTLRPAAPGTPGDHWISSFDVMIDGERVLQKGAQVNRTDIADAFDKAIAAGLKPSILAFGVYVAPDVTVSVSSVTFNGNTYFFTAAPVVEEAVEEPVAEPTEEQAVESTVQPKTEAPIAKPVAEVPTAVKTTVSFTG